ncbi:MULTISPECIES: FecR family protein [Methylobacter]
MKNPADIFSKSDNEQDELIAEQAIAWFTRLQLNSLSNQEKLQFQSWKAQSPAHEQAYEEISQLWNNTDFNLALGQTKLSYPLRQTEQKPARIYRKHRASALAMAAGFALFVVLSDPMTWLQADFYTGVGDQQTVQLSDGSSVTLNTDSAIAVAFDSDERRVNLLKGEAYFDVQTNKQRPFVVNSGETETQVLGTRFIVRDGSSEDKVTVIKGLVKVSNLQQEQSVFLHPDEQVTNTKSGLTAISKTTNKDTAWLQGRLSFQDAPMAEVVKELDRYLPGMILLNDNSLKDYRINARFDITHPAQALDALEQTLPIKITRLSNWVTVISQR